MEMGIVVRIHVPIQQEMGSKKKMERKVKENDDFGRECGEARTLAE
jgi:hypothetical protein